MITGYTGFNFKSDLCLSQNLIFFWVFNFVIRLKFYFVIILAHFFFLVCWSWIECPIAWPLKIIFTMQTLPRCPELSGCNWVKDHFYEAQCHRQKGRLCILASVCMVSYSFHCPYSPYWFLSLDSLEFIFYRIRHKRLLIGLLII